MSDNVIAFVNKKTLSWCAPVIIFEAGRSSLSELPLPQQFRNISYGKQ